MSIDTSLAVVCFCSFICFLWSLPYSPRYIWWGCSLEKHYDAIQQRVLLVCLRWFQMHCVNSFVPLHDNSNVYSSIQLPLHVVDVQLWLHLVTGLLPSSMRGVWTTRKECEYLLLTSSSSSLSVASSSSSTSSSPPSSSSWSSEKDIKGNRLNSTKPQKVLIWFLSESKNSIWTKSNFFH